VSIGYSPVGLRNIGNTCFMNSILQCIFASPDLSSYFTSQFQSDHFSRRTPLSDSYSTLLQQVRSKSSVVSPDALKSQVTRVCSRFSGYGQQDAQEFLRFFLDGMSMELNRNEGKRKYQEMNVDHLTMDQQSEQWWQYFKNQEDSPITDLFQGQLVNRIHCEECGHDSLAFDAF